MTILDQHGNPIDTGRLAEPQTSEAAYLAREWETHPSRGLTPAGLHSLLVAAEQGDLVRQLDLADDMEERDGHLFAEMDKRVGAVAALKWGVVEPEAASADEKKLTAAVREWLAAIPDVEDLVRALMSAVLRAFANVEMVWAPQDGVLLPKLTLRPHRWFCTDRETRTQLRLRRTDMADGEPLRPFAWVSHLHRARNGLVPRMGLVRVLAWPYLYLNYSTRDLAELLRIYGLPLRVGKYPAGASREEKASLLRAVTEIGSNAAGIIPQGMMLEFQRAAEGTQGPFESMQDRMERIESKVILGQTLTSGEGQHGTQALGNVHNSVRLDIRDSDARQVEATINRQLIYPLCVLNRPGVDRRRLPRFSIETVEPEDMAALAEALPKLAGAGMRIGLKWAHDKLRVPEAQAGEAVLQPGPASAQPAQPGAPVPPPAAPRRSAAAALATATGQPAPAPRDAIDEMVDDAVAEWQPLLEPMVGPLLAELDNAIARGESLAAFGARLDEMLGAMDSRPLAEKLARAAFAARLAGEADLDLQR